MEADPRPAHMVASYRYLRLAMLILVVTLAVSVAIERARASCLQGSVSSYYYTPVHAVFVGALVAVGVSLVALKGRDDVEDLFFNLAGVLAPVVAFVPTGRPERLCSRQGDSLDLRTTALVSNNVPALLFGAACAIGIAYWVAKRQGKVELRKPPRAAFVGITLSAVLLLVGVWWYRAEGEHFEKYAHGTAAVVMFVAIWCAVLVNAGWPPPVLRWLYRVLAVTFPEPDTTLRQRRYRDGYRVAATVMALAALVVLATLKVRWEQRVFWLEVAEIAPFAMFWTLQTLQAWDTGVTNLVEAGDPEANATPAP